MVGSEGSSIMGDMGSSTGNDDPEESERGQKSEFVRRRMAGSEVCKETDGKLRRQTSLSRKVGRYGILDRETSDLMGRARVGCPSGPK